MTNNLDFIELPTEWDMTSDKDADIAELLGQKVKDKMEDGVVFINPYHISSYNEGANNTTTVRIITDVYKIKMRMKDFKLLLNQYKNQQ